MKKIIFLFLLLIPFINVYATNASSTVSSNLSYSECLNIQDNSMSNVSGSGYVRQCVKVSCYTDQYKISFLLTKNLISCANGNVYKYYVPVKDGCSSYSGYCREKISNNPDSICTSSDSCLNKYTQDLKYCSLLIKYDCNLTSNGSPFTPPTVPVTEAPVVTQAPSQTVKPKTQKPVVKTTTAVQVKDSNTYLSDLSFSVGEIKFNKLLNNYTLTIPEDTTKIDVKATPEKTTSTVKIENNETISFETPIKITVTAENGDTRIYTITLSKEEVKLDEDNKLKSLKIDGYTIKFDPDINNYDLKIKRNTTKLNIEVETNSEKAVYEIIGNSNLKNKSKIEIDVTSESGETNAYIINIKKSSVIGLVIIILIIAGIIGYVIYKLVKNMVPQKEEESYEYE